MDLTPAPALETADRFFTERCGKEIVNSVEGRWAGRSLEGSRGWAAADRGPERRRPWRHSGRHAALLRMAGSHVFPCHRETALASLLIARRAASPARPATLVLGNLKLAGGRLSGKVERVPFAAVADRSDHRRQHARRCRQGQRQGRGQASHAGEPCGTVSFDNATHSS